MKYIDKISGKSISLEPIKGEYLIKFREGFQGETLMTKISQAEGFNFTKWVADDFLAVLKFNGEAEKTQAFKQTLDRIREDESVEDIIPALSDMEGFTRYIVPNRLLIAYNPGDQNALSDKLSGEFTIINRSRFGNWFIITLPLDMELEEAVERFNNMPEVQYCEPAFYGIGDAEIHSTDTLKWNLESINMPEAWEVPTPEKPEIVIAILDGKPDLSHPVFRSTRIEDIPDKWGFSNTQTLTSHSTQILSILASKSAEIRGICPNVRFMPLIVKLEAQYYSQRAEAIHYLASILETKGEINQSPVSRIIANCSWKTAGDVGVIREAIRCAASAGVIFVTSAGNENSSGPHYPSDYSQTIPGILSVAALSPNNRRAEYSNYSTTVNMSAPGGGGLPLDLDDIYCADLNNTYSYSAGTSLAAPHVAGIIALMLSVNPDLDFSEIKQILEQTAISIQQENFETWRLLGAGKLNAGQALKKVVDNLGVPSSQPGVNTGSTPVTSPIGTQTTGPKIKITFGENGTVNDSNKINQIVQDVTDRVSVEIRQLLQKQRYDQIHTLRITLELNEYTTVIDRAI